MTHPKPDRSSYVPNFSKSADDDVVDIGWREGGFQDGRPYRLEAWAQDGITSVTVFVPTAGLETYSNEQFVELLEREHVVWWRPGARKSAFAMPYTDSAGRPVWSINVMIGMDTEAPVADSVGLLPYDKRTRDAGQS